MLVLRKKWDANTYTLRIQMLICVPKTTQSITQNSMNSTQILCKSKYWRNNLVELVLPFRISRQICFFSEVGLSEQCPQPSFT
jgi:hypothetical protein